MPSTTDTSAPFRIAIVGGGIGGLACALFVHHHCTSSPISPPIHIDVYEQASQYKEIGAGVGVGINAARLLHKIGIGDRLNAIAGHRTGIWISFRRFDTSEDIVTMPVNDSQTVRQAPCARTDLLDLLRETVEEREAATLHVKKHCKSVEEKSDIVNITFHDGTTASANLVIACDGIHSSVRSQFVPDNRAYSGQIAYRGVIPISSLSAWPFPSYSVAWLAKHRHFLVFPISGNEKLNIVAFITKSEREVADVKESWTSTCDRKEVEESFEGFDKTVQEVISLMPEQPSKWKLNDRPPLDKWHYMDGKVILLGDAAHAMLPHLGAGAGQAMEDGWILGRSLAEYLAGRPASEASLVLNAGSTHSSHFQSLSSTAQLYQSVRLPRANKTQATSRAAGNTYEMQTEDMIDKSFEECIPMIAERTRERMKWVWEEDLDAAYEKMRDGKAETSTKMDKIDGAKEEMSGLVNGQGESQVAVEAR